MSRVTVTSLTETLNEASKVCMESAPRASLAKEPIRLPWEVGMAMLQELPNCLDLRRYSCVHTQAFTVLSRAVV